MMTVTSPPRKKVYLHDTITFKYFFHINMRFIFNKLIFFLLRGWSVNVTGETFELTCFEDIYLSTRQGLWIQQDDILIQVKIKLFEFI